MQVSASASASASATSASNIGVQANNRFSRCVCKVVCMCVLRSSSVYICGYVNMSSRVGDKVYRPVQVLYIDRYPPIYIPEI